MTKEQKTTIARIHNTLAEIATKGRDTLLMADCLKALENLYSADEEKAKPKTKKTEKKESK